MKPGLTIAAYCGLQSALFRSAKTSPVKARALALPIGLIQVVTTPLLATALAIESLIDVILNSVGKACKPSMYSWKDAGISFAILITSPLLIALSPMAGIVLAIASIALLLIRPTTTSNGMNSFYGKFL